MERHAYHKYKILKQIEQSPKVTNRVMARKLDVSVKLAHELLAGLVKRGLLHIRKHHARRWDYYLTPAGIAERARLTIEFLDFSMQFYREARRRSAEVLSKASKSGVKRVAFLGATELAEIASLGVREWHLEIVDVFDDECAGKNFLGLQVRPISGLNQTAAEKILVTAFDPSEPMARRYLPRGTAPDSAEATFDEETHSKFLWIFDNSYPSAPARQAMEDKTR